MTQQTNPAAPQMGNDVVGALFTERNAASIAIDELHYAGFENNQVGLVVRDGDEWKVTGMGQNTDADDAPTLSSNRTGVATGDRNDNNIDDATAVPPVVVAPSPQASSGVPATGGGISAVPPVSTGAAGLFAAYGFDDTMSGRLSGDLEKGALLVVVKAPGRSTEAKHILERNGGKMAR
jgi:hypothetical protein